METRFEELRRRLGELSDLGKIGELLSWDEETKMPPAGAAARAEQRAALQRVVHERATAPELGALLEQLRPFEENHAPDSFEASLVRVARRDFEKAVRVPAELRVELARFSSTGYRAWLEARRERDYGILLPHLRHGLELRRRYVDCFEHDGDPYDVLLDDYEPGTTAADVERVFARLREALVPLVAAAAEAPPVDDSCLHGRFPAAAQRRLALALLEHWGLDGDAWRLDLTVHPFAASPGPSDIRLTTNFSERDINGVLSCLHEFGHGLYERQLDPALARTPLAQGASMAFHESQSRLWENLVGRNLATWRFFYPRLAAELPTFAEVPLETFHRALNAVRPSLRRVDADEVTYCLHVVLRFELERDVLSGRVSLDDLPEAFDAKLLEYLGLVPADDVEGVLQDAHWADLSFGYFPTYALGNVISVQLWERARADLGDLEALFEQGRFEPLREWLREHVHRWGRMLTPPELLERAGGGPLDPEPYLLYLRGKVEALTAAAGTG